ncbi:MAG: hypothetical protein K8W52_21810 [Deltaproteobacteria bacterium]|nr:hypothetical protein [Deltaproteobacteria bacterium]
MSYRWIALLLVGCGTSGSGVQGSGVQGSNAQADPCGALALGLTGATLAPAYTFPAGCAPTAAFASGPVIASDADFAAQLACPAGTATGVDFTREVLRAARRTLSPAGAGTRVMDDGKTLTYVSMQRPNCPGDPMPMPMEVPMLVRTTPGDRAIAERVCTVARSCP